MAYMTWTKDMSVSVAVLDDDHRKLFDIINELHDGIVAGHKKEILLAILGHLVNYTKFHFAREEEYFIKTNYWEATAHKMEHNIMVQKIANVLSRFNSAPVAMLDLELMSFLRIWLITHIQGSDKLYGPHLNAKGFR